MSLECKQLIQDGGYRVSQHVWDADCCVTIPVAVQHYVLWNDEMHIAHLALEIARHNGSMTVRLYFGPGLDLVAMREIEGEGYIK